MIADGNFNEPIPMIGNKDEIQELRESFVYMQKRIVESIENLRISTIEKEKIEGEMRVAQRIQETIPSLNPPNLEIPFLPVCPFGTIQGCRRRYVQLFREKKLPLFYRG